MSDNSLFMTKEEFEKEYEELVDERLLYTLENPEEIYNKNNLPLMLPPIKRLYYYDPIFENYDARITSKLKCLSNDIDFWTEYSFRPRSRREVILKTIGEKIYDKHIICFSYLSSSGVLDEDLIDNIVYIQNSPVFSFNDWNQDNVDKEVQNFLKKAADFEYNAAAAIFIKELPVKLDWKILITNKNFDNFSSKYNCITSK